MIPVSELRSGMVLKLDGELFRVISFELHGAAKAGRVFHAKLKNVSAGVIADRRFRADEKVDDVAVETTNMEYLYRDGPTFYFMNLSTYEQIAIAEQTIGPAGKYLKPNLQLMVELNDGRPLNVVFPKIIEMKVVLTGPGVSGQADSTYKEADLENGAKAMVPQFIKEGDTVKIEVETGRYIDRVVVK